MITIFGSKLEKKKRCKLMLGFTNQSDLSSKSTNLATVQSKHLVSHLKATQFSTVSDLLIPVVYF